jgi:hypothetical protein
VVVFEEAAFKKYQQVDEPTEMIDVEPQGGSSQSCQ